MHKIRNSNGQFDGINSLESYILKECQKHKAEKRAFAFVLIIYDFDDPQITKILDDDNYFNALDFISGEFLTVFYIHSEYLTFQSEKAKESNTMRMEFDVQKVHGPVNLSPKYLGEKLINNSSLPSPSMIFFNTSDYVITDYTIARLRENEIEKGFNEMLSIIKTAVDSLKKVKEENRANEQEIFNLIKLSVDGSEFWRSAKISFNKMLKIRDFIFFWKI